MPPQKNARAIFIAAIEEHRRETWDEFVERACGADHDLRKEVQLLLKAHVEMGTFAPTEDAVPATEDHVSALAEGTTVGPYKLLQRIGEGGFGVVYMAEQTAPVRRQVAVKIIKPGMDTKEVVARFEAERQALALMEHPHIAKVLDAGSTESGRPYFVMELVKGVPITEFCDRNQLNARQRLDLFISICHAVQHAHQKGVIHRDLKPSNVMVTLHDGNPVVKVIDFGIAKAISQRLTERTLFTRYGQMVGTPAYMSPEQAEMSGLDMDTRSDIYSLGVMLYELLTGTTPLESERLRSAGYAEMVRMIQEEEPPKPSIRLSTLKDQLPIVCRKRSTDGKRLRKRVQGDLDWIVMKSLEKDRSRRYESASAFAADIQRHLNNEPVLAGPPSRTYQLRKFLRRNKGPVSVGLIVGTALIGGLGAALWGLVVANKAISHLQTAQGQIRQNLLHRALAAAVGGSQSTPAFLGPAREAGATDADIDFVEGIMYWARGDHEKSRAKLNECLAADPTRISAKIGLGVVALQAGFTDDSLGMRDKLKEALVQLETPEDHLFFGILALGFPKVAKEIAEYAHTVQPSPLAQTVFALTLQELALQNQSVKLATKAVETATQAEALLGGDNRYVHVVLGCALYAKIVVLEGKNRDASAIRLTARKRADKILSFPYLLPVSAWTLGAYYDFVEDDQEKSREAYQRAVSSEEGDCFHTIYASFVLREDGLEKAIAAIKTSNRRSSYGLATQAQLLALQPNTRNKAREMWQKIGPKPSADRVVMVPLLLGDVEAAKKYAEECRGVIPPIVQFVVDYLVGLKSDQEFDAVAATAPSMYTCKYYKGMKYLAKGDRTKAIRFFREVYAGRFYKRESFQWAEAFLRQMEADPKWPYGLSAASKANVKSPPKVNPGKRQDS